MKGEENKEGKERNITFSCSQFTMQARLFYTKKWLIKKSQKKLKGSCNVHIDIFR